MMVQVFTTILNMSITASFVVGLVLLIRLCLKQFPKIYSYILWSVVLLRLLCPFALAVPFIEMPFFSDAAKQTSPSTSTMSYFSVEKERDRQREFSEPIIPVAAAEPQTTDDYVPKAEDWVAPHTESAPVSSEPEGKSAGEIILTVLSYIWAAGAAFFIGITAWQNISLRRRLDEAFILRGNIYESAYIDTAFVLGVINPKIYMPKGLPYDVQKTIVAHEQTHQRRGDHIVKFISYFALSIHWFNPLVWLSFKLMTADMEASCDEAVVRSLQRRGYTEKSVKYAYSKMLFALGSGKLNILSPVSFAEGSIGARIENIAKSRRLRRNVAITVSCLLVAVLLISTVNPFLALADTGEKGIFSFNTDKNSSDSINDGYVPKLNNVISYDMIRTEDEDIPRIDFGGELLKSNTPGIYFSAALVDDLTPLFDFPNLRALSIQSFDMMSPKNRELLYELECVVDLDIVESRKPISSELLIEILENMPQLEALSTNITYNPENEPNGLDDKLIDALASRKNINKLSLCGQLPSADNNYYFGDDATAGSYLGIGPQTYNAYYSLNGYSCRQLGRISQLTHLYLFEIDDIQFIETMPNLTHLSCRLTGIDVDEFEALQSRKRLEVLDAFCGYIHNSSENADFPENLKELYLTVGEITQPSAVGRLKKLQTFYLEHCYSDISGFFSNLGELRELKLRLDDCASITKDTFKALSRLEYLYLDNYTFADLEAFSSLPNLREVVIDANPIGRSSDLPSDIDVRPLALAPSLKALSIKNCDNNILWQLSAFENSGLKSLCIDYYSTTDSGIDRKPLDSVFQISDLERLLITHVPLDSNAVSSIAKLSKLKELYISIDADAITTLNCIGDIPKLERVFLYFDYDVKYNNNYSSKIAIAIDEIKAKNPACDIVVCYGYG